MPQINDYGAPETEGAEPLGGISPNTEMVGAAGRGIARLGGQVSEAGDIVHRRMAQEETSNVYSKIAGLRAQYSTNLQKAALQPDFDTQKFQQAYADDVQKVGDTLTTAEGQDYFQRQASRLGGALLTQASKLQAHATYIKYQAQTQGDLDEDAVTVHDNPEMLDSVLDSRNAHLAKESDNDASGKIAMIAPKMKFESEQALTIAALKGITDKDRGSALNEIEGAGQKALDSKKYDGYLSIPAREQVQRYITRQAHAADIDAKAGDKALDLQRQKDVDGAETMFTELMKQHKLTSTAIENYKGSDGKPLLKWDEIKKYEGWVKQNSAEDFDSNSTFKADVIRRMNLPPGAEGAITEPGEVRHMFAPGKLSLRDSDAFANHLAKTDEAKEEAAAEKLFMRQAMEKIRYKEQPNADNNYTSTAWAKEGDAKLGQFQSMINTAKANMRTAGKPTADLWDPTNAAYLGGRVDDYITARSARLKTSSVAIQQLNEEKAKGVRVVDENGNPGRYKKDDIEAWLKANPKRTRAK